MNTKHLDLLHHNIWFAQLEVHFQDFIIQHGKIMPMDKHQTAFHSGDVFDGIYAVLEGSICLGYIDLHGKEAVSAIIEPIMWFGEISLVDHQPRSHDAIALQKSVLLHLPSTAMMRLLEHYPAFWFHIAQLTTQKLRHAFLELISIQTQSLQQRLAQRLLFILNGYGNHQHIQNMNIQLSQEQMAQMLMSSRQTIHQELHQLEHLGIIRLGFKHIEVVDLPKLRLLANGKYSQNKTIKKPN